MPGDNTEAASSVPIALHGVATPTARRRRTDAEQNRTRILDVARHLAATRGIGQVTMDALAEAAGVGKGTLYRGFGSRAGLVEALLDDAERELQEQILTGPPPLGAGRAARSGRQPRPADRLEAFVVAYLRLLRSNAELLVETERGRDGARFHTGAYGFWHAHVAGLLRAHGRPDASVRAHTLLAMLSADLYQHLRASNVDHDELVTVVTDLARRT